MQRLTGLDAGFLSMETGSSPMHVAGLAVFDPSTVPGGWSLEQVKEVYRDRLHLAPPFRRRLRGVPFGLHFPLWIEDPDFDLDWHIRHIAVPPPGGARELAELASHLVALPLDRSRPLWEMWVIEGLEGGHVAALSKVHHAAIDGVSGNELAVAVLDTSPEVEEHPPPEEPWEPDRVPSDVEMLAFAAQSFAKSPLQMVRAVQHTIDGVLRRRQAVGGWGSQTPSTFDAPRTSLNCAITSQRSFAHATLSLSDVKRVKDHFDVRVNDVVLALCSGALRRYLDARGEKPDGPLVAMVPVSVRTEDEQGAMGNKVSQMLCSLATDVDDPVLRLQVIQDGTRQAKKLHAVSADALTDWAEFAAPAVLGRAARLYSRTGLASRMRPPFNVVVSNVPGPPFPLYSAGAKMLANYPMGPIFEGLALNMTVMSYQDSLDFGLVACPDVVDDVWELADGLHDAMEELLKALGQDDAGAVTHGEPGDEDGDEPTGGSSEEVIAAAREQIAASQETRQEAESVAEALDAFGDGTDSPPTTEDGSRGETGDQSG